MGAFGNLVVYNDVETVLTAVTVEKPWKNNERFISCVPAGAYVLEKHSSEKYGETYALVGGTVSHYEEEGKERYTCLLHGGNTHKAVEGCIAVATRPGMPGELWGNVSSRKKKKALLKRINSVDEQHPLEIR